MGQGLGPGSDSIDPCDNKCDRGKKLTYDISVSCSSVADDETTIAILEGAKQTDYLSEIY
jgi:hypothetical protein